MIEAFISVIQGVCKQIPCMADAMTASATPTVAKTKLRFSEETKKLSCTKEFLNRNKPYTVVHFSRFYVCINYSLVPIAY